MKLFGKNLLDQQYYPPDICLQKRRKKIFDVWCPKNISDIFFLQKANI